MKKGLMVLFALLLVGCGNDAELAQKNTEIENLQQELISLQNEITSLNEGSVNESEVESSQSQEEQTEDLSVQKDTQIDIITFGSRLQFEDFEILIGFEDDIIWRQLENRFSDKDGADVFGIPVTLTNLGDETGNLSSSRYKFFSPDGTEISSISSYFRDDDIWSQGDMRPEASQEGYFMIEYVGDGDYIIEFSSWSESNIDVILSVSK